MLVLAEHGTCCQKMLGHSFAHVMSDVPISSAQAVSADLQMPDLSILTVGKRWWAGTADSCKAQGQIPQRCRSCGMGLQLSGPQLCVCSTTSMTGRPSGTTSMSRQSGMPVARWAVCFYIKVLHEET